MGTTKFELSELSEKVLQGVRKASRKLVEERAASGGFLVIFVDGEIKRVLAKDLLSRTSGSPQNSDH